MLNIHKLKANQYKFYKNIVSIFCPVLNDTVYFSGSGFKHLLYKSHGSPRNVNEQFLKLKCLNGVPEVIKNCKVISQTRQYEKKLKGKTKFAVSYELAYYTTLGEEIRVIVERIGTGKHQFLSVMPHRKRKGKIKAPN